MREDFNKWVSTKAWNRQLWGLEKLQWAVVSTPTNIFVNQASCIPADMISDFRARASNFLLNF